MSTLEDAFLKKNVPGRYSSWADNDDDRRAGDDLDDASNADISDSEDDEYYFEGLPPNSSTTTASTQQSQLRPSGNTGVKGVLADYREAKRIEQLTKDEERKDRLEALHRATRPAVSDRISNGRKDVINDKNDSGDSELDDSDDEFLQQFRSQRLAQLQSTSTSHPTFGSLTQTSPEDYVTLVDTVDPQVFLIVFLYEPSILQCRQLQSILEKVAPSMNYAKFIEVNALDANPNLDTICLPAILIYKQGKLVHNLVRFTDDLPKGYGVDEVRNVFERIGVVDLMSANIGERLAGK